MGINYYFYIRPKCPTCYRPFEPMHMGKSSAGWCFSLHIYPDLGIKDLSDWVDFIGKYDLGYIEDEYGNTRTLEYFLNIVREREWKGGPPMRHDVDRFCVGHGKGTWDLFEREFS